MRKCLLFVFMFAFFTFTVFAASIPLDFDSYTDNLQQYGLNSGASIMPNSISPLTKNIPQYFFNRNSLIFNFSTNNPPLNTSFLASSNVANSLSAYSFGFNSTLFNFLKMGLSYSILSTPTALPVYTDSSTALVNGSLSCLLGLSFYNHIFPYGGVDFITPTASSAILEKANLFTGLGFYYYPFLFNFTYNTDTPNILDLFWNVNDNLLFSLRWKLTKNLNFSSVYSFSKFFKVYGSVNTDSLWKIALLLQSDNWNTSLSFQNSKIYLSASALWDFSPSIIVDVPKTIYLSDYKKYDFKIKFFPKSLDGKSKQCKISFENNILSLEKTEYTVFPNRELIIPIKPLSQGNEMVTFRIGNQVFKREVKVMKRKCVLELPSVIHTDFMSSLSNHYSVTIKSDSALAGKHFCLKIQDIEGDISFQNGQKTFTGVISKNGENKVLFSNIVKKVGKFRVVLTIEGFEYDNKTVNIVPSPENISFNLNSNSNCYAGTIAKITLMCKDHFGFDAETSVRLFLDETPIKTISFKGVKKISFKIPSNIEPGKHKMIIRSTSGSDFYDSKTLTLLPIPNQIKISGFSKGSMYIQDFFSSEYIINALYNGVGCANFPLNISLSPDNGSILYSKTIVTNDNGQAALVFVPKGNVVPGNYTLKVDIPYLNKQKVYKFNLESRVYKLEIVSAKNSVFNVAQRGLQQIPVRALNLYDMPVSNAYVHVNIPQEFRSVIKIAGSTTYKTDVNGIAHVSLFVTDLFSLSDLSKKSPVYFSISSGKYSKSCELKVHIPTKPAFLLSNKIDSIKLLPGVYGHPLKIRLINENAKIPNDSPIIGQTVECKLYYPGSSTIILQKNYTTDSDGYITYVPFLSLDDYDAYKTNRYVLEFSSKDASIKINIDILKSYSTKIEFNLLTSIFSLKKVIINGKSFNIKNNVANITIDATKPYMELIDTNNSVIVEGYLDVSRVFWDNHLIVNVNRGTFKQNQNNISYRLVIQDSKGNIQPALIYDNSSDSLIAYDTDGNIMIPNKRILVKIVPLRKYNQKKIYYSPINVILNPYISTQSYVTLKKGYPIQVSTETYFQNLSDRQKIGFDTTIAYSSITNTSNIIMGKVYSDDFHSVFYVLPQDLTYEIKDIDANTIFSKEIESNNLSFESTNYFTDEKLVDSKRKVFLKVVNNSSLVAGAKLFLKNIVNEDSKSSETSSGGLVLRLSQGIYKVDAFYKDKVNIYKGSSYFTLSNEFHNFIYLHAGINNIKIICRYANGDYYGNKNMKAEILNTKNNDNSVLLASNRLKTNQYGVANITVNVSSKKGIFTNNNYILKVIGDSGAIVQFKLRPSAPNTPETKIINCYIPEVFIKLNKINTSILNINLSLDNYDKDKLDIEIDGVKYNDLNDIVLSNGFHNLSIKYPGYLPYFKKILMDKNKEKDLNVFLTPKYFYIMIHSNRSVYHIKLDGKPVNSNIFKVPYGLHSIVLSSPNSYDMYYDMLVDSNKFIDANFSSVHNLATHRLLINAKNISGDLLQGWKITLKGSLISNEHSIIYNKMFENQNSPFKVSLPEGIYSIVVYKKTENELLKAAKKIEITDDMNITMYLSSSHSNIK